MAGNNCPFKKADPSPLIMSTFLCCWWLVEYMWGFGICKVKLKDYLTAREETSHKRERDKFFPSPSSVDKTNACTWLSLLWIVVVLKYNRINKIKEMLQHVDYKKDISEGWIWRSSCTQEQLKTHMADLERDSDFYRPRRTWLCSSEWENSGQNTFFLLK